MSEIYLRNNIIDEKCYKLKLPLKHTLILSAIGDFVLDDNGDITGSKITNGELAFLLRTSRYEVSRCLAWLHEQKYIDFRGQANKREIKRGERFYQEIYGYKDTDELDAMFESGRIINPSFYLALISAKREKGWY